MGEYVPRGRILSLNHGTSICARDESKAWGGHSFKLGYRTFDD